jgi:DNA gyrase subunit A
LVITSRGYGKRTPMEQYKTQGRGGSGIITAHVTDKTGTVSMAVVVRAKDDRDLLAVSQNAQVIRLPIGEVSVLGRDTQGVRIMRFKEAGDAIASVTLVDPSTGGGEEAAE